MKRAREAWSTAARSFWFLPGLCVVTGIVAGLGLPALDSALDADPSLPFFTFDDAGAARGLLETVATVTVSVAGISFSVTVVALQLASQQLSPRVLRTFQEDRLNQVTLGVFLGTFVYCLLVLAGFSQEVPKLSMAVAVIAATVAFLLFVAFIHNIVESLQASTMIRRMAADGRKRASEPFPAGVGGEPEDGEEAERQARAATFGEPALAIRAGRAGFLIAIDGPEMLAAASSADALVVQRARIGEFVLSGQELAVVHAGELDDRDGLGDRIRAAFQQSQQRTLDQDVSFPIRQLADVALRALSASLNDPTTAENAMSSIAETLILHAHGSRPHRVRVDAEGRPRLVCTAPDFDELVRLGFEQVRQHADAHPVVLCRLIDLLVAIRAAAAESGIDSTEPERQIELIGRQPPDDVGEEEARRVCEAAAGALGRAPGKARHG